MVGADHIMVGTDYPFDLGDWRAAEKIDHMKCTSAEREAMLHGNARNYCGFGEPQLAIIRMKHRPN